MAIYGLLGRTLGHSFSPAIHKALGNDAYALYEVEPDQVEAFVTRADLGGLNVTIPYKETVLPFCSELAPEVQAIGAANVLVNQGGKLVAHNTDALGFLRMVQESGISVAGKKVLVLGTGGASKAVQYALTQLNPSTVVLISRGGQDNYENLSRHADADIIINTTPVGMFPNNGASPVSLSDFPKLSGVLDLIYNPLRTELLLQAEALGIPFAGGLSMLVAQGIAAHELFFGVTAPETAYASILQNLTKAQSNIILCGMPGCGKSTLASALGERTGREVLDTDEEIVKLAGKSIPDIFAEDGEETFRNYEHQVIVELGKRSGVILSLGGGAVLREDNYGPLHQNGRIFRIDRNLSLLATDGRPLSKDLTTLEEMKRNREPRYSRFSDETLDNNGSVEELIDKFLARY